MLLDNFINLTAVKTSFFITIYFLYKRSTKSKVQIIKYKLKCWQYLFNHASEHKHISIFAAIWNSRDGGLKTASRFGNMLYVVYTATIVTASTAVTMVTQFTQNYFSTGVYAFRCPRWHPNNSPWWIIFAPCWIWQKLSCSTLFESVHILQLAHIHSL